jgi:hypothetical protein
VTMSDLNKLSENTQKVITDFIKEYTVLSLDVDRSIDLSGQAISHLTFNCFHDGDRESHEYKVEFKLTEQYVDLVDLLTSIRVNPTTITLGDNPKELDQGMLELTLRSFFKFIVPRMDKAKQEEEIQSIPFVDNTFILNKRTTFKVLTNDGEGRLTIEIIGKSHYTADELSLSSHGLMDGLYSGMIKEAFPPSR